jgi:hypothetical protein
MRNTSVAVARLRKELTALSGLTCWGIVGGSDTQRLAIDFGSKRRWRVPLTNPKLSEEQRRYGGVPSLFVECAWRLDGEHEVLRCSSERGDEGELGVLVGSSVKRSELREPGLDCEIAFTNGVSLLVFCDSGSETEDDCNDNYSLFLEREVVTVGPRSRIVVEGRESPFVNGD